MAKTYTRQGIQARIAGHPSLSMALKMAPEKASQTWPAGTPIVITGGFAVEGASPLTAVWGIAVDAGKNGATDGAKKTRYLPVIDGVTFWANFLDSANPDTADNAYADADFGGDFQVKKVTLASGQVIWTVLDTGTTAGATMVGIRSDEIPPNNADAEVVMNGDINARPEFAFLDSIRTFK